MAAAQGVTDVGLGFALRDAPRCALLGVRSTGSPVILVLQLEGICGESGPGLATLDPVKRRCHCLQQIHPRRQETEERLNRERRRRLTRAPPLVASQCLPKPAPGWRLNTFPNPASRACSAGYT